MKKTLLTILILGIGIGALNAADITERAARPLVETYPQSLSIFAPTDTRFVAMNVRVYTAEGALVLNYRSRGETVDIPVADLADGEYRYESVAIIATDDTEEPEIAKRNFGSFMIRNGEIQAERTPLRDELSQVLQHGTGLALSWLVSDAHADLFTHVEVEDDTPFIDFDDLTSGAGDDWSLSGYETHFGVWDYTTLGWAIRIERNDNNKNSFRVNSSGDVSLADQAIFIDRSATRLGIGTTAPAVELAIHDTSPEIRLFDESDDSKMHLEYNGGSFRIEGNNSQQDVVIVSSVAPASALVVDSVGNIGLGTKTPVTDLQLYGIGSSAQFSMGDQTDSNFWNINTGELGLWFSNKATTGSPSNAAVKFSRLAPADALTVNSDNTIGLGTDTPAAALEVLRNNGTAKIQVTEVSGIIAPRTLFELRNPGNTKFSLTNTDAAVEWAFANPGTGFRVSRQGSGVVEFDLLNNGNLTIAGTLTENSDRNAKTNIVAIDQQAILEKIQELPIQQWQYKDALGENHIGPMAQDFYAAFGLGGTDKGIATLDSSGVALAAIQALAADNQHKQQQINQLLADNQALKQSQRELLAVYHQERDANHQQNQRLQQLEVLVKSLSPEPISRLTQR